MRVLIAHANEVTRGRLADVVTRGRRHSLDIQHSGDGPETLDLLLADDPPEVALIDWDLPGIEAPEMCRLVRDFHSHHDTWIIVLTSRAHQESASDVWRAGGDDCVYTPAPAKLLSDRVTKGLCEMAQPMREAAATLVAAASEEDAGSPFAAEHPTLDAVCRSDDEIWEGDGFTGLSADLKATVDAEDVGGPAELAAGPVVLSAQRVELEESDDAPRGKATLDAVLARL